ncbi:unnamed protein product [marine sediment metagenome]|uniref:Uncharacterized protein n=1 Tax=marine sediment metagenome TaxID=412755 RepID=X1VKK7_9ZZZZ
MLKPKSELRITTQTNKILQILNRLINICTFEAFSNYIFLELYKEKGFYTSWENLLKHSKIGKKKFSLNKVILYSSQSKFGKKLQFETNQLCF